MHSPTVHEQAMRLVHAGLNDCEVARRTGIARTTIRDWRRPPYKPQARHQPLCPRCGLRGRQLSFAPGDYSELLGLYLGDGHIVRMPRTWQLRVFLDSRHKEILRDTEEILRRSFGGVVVSKTLRHEGRMTILGVCCQHIRCILPQHGPGKKHQRPIALEPWQQTLVEREPWRFLRGCIRSDGCAFVNRTGAYEYLSYDFSNHSRDILDIFCATCALVGIEHRRYERRVRIYRRASVTLMEANVGLKR